MAFEEVIDVRESAVFKAIFLLFVSSVEDGTDEVVCLLPFDYVVQHLSIVKPDEVSKR